MNLYLLRHAQALPMGEHGISSDEERPLTEEGWQRTAVLARALERLEISFDLVLSSPLRRGLQTAEGLLRHLQRSDLVVTPCEQLAPDWSSRKLAKKLLTVDCQEILLVGHEPSLSKHAAWLIGSKDARLEFAKGGMACIRCDGVPQKGAGTLSWLITPKWLNLIAE